MKEISKVSLKAMTFLKVLYDVSNWGQIKPRRDSTDGKAVDCGVGGPKFDPGGDDFFNL